jgi:hypothetical protein
MDKIKPTQPTGVPVQGDVETTSESVFMTHEVI